ncbi:MAG: DEAD/DEAH box helicase, partial [Candidatus Methanoperedens sp.]
MQLIKPMDNYFNFLDVEQNKSLDKIIKEYKKGRVGLDRYLEGFESDSNVRISQKISEMLRASTALSLYGELLFLEDRFEEDGTREWHDFLVLSARNYQKIIEIIELNKMKGEIFPIHTKYQLMLMSLFEFHNARRHAIAKSLSQRALETLEAIEKNFGNKEIDRKTLSLHKCLIFFLKAEFSNCREFSNKVLNDAVNEIQEKEEYLGIPEIYDTIGISYILKSLVSIIGYIEEGDEDKLSIAFKDINEAIKYAAASKRVDLRYFSNKLNISYKILSELSMWNIKKLFDFEKTNSKTALNEYIRLKIKNGHYFMFTSQYDALFEKKILDKEKNSLISIPTGAGKTFLAEVLILKRLLKLRYEDKNKNSIIVYLVPSRALAREKFDDFTKAFDGENKLKFKTCQITGEIVLNADEAIEKNDIVIMTQEKFDMILREEFFGVGIDTLIVDEFHNIRSGYRGLKLQFAIIRFKDLPAYKKSNIFLISAIVKKENFDEIGNWIYAENLFQTEWKPTFTRIGIISLDDPERLIHFNDGIAIDSKMPDEIQSAHTGIAARWLASKFAEDEPVLLFSTYVNIPYENKNHLLDIARELSQSDLKIPYMQTFNEKYSTKLKRIVGNEEIYEYFKKGIGVHWGQLPHPVRKIMEDAVKDKAIGILISTTTLAEGVNLPIKTIIIPSLMIQDEPMDFGLFFNLIGRAGRPFKHAEGQIILIASDKGHRNPLEKVNRYYNAKRENIEPIKSPIHLIFKLRDEIIPKYEKIYSNKPTERNLNRLEDKKKELKVHEANLEAVMLAMVAEKLVHKIANNNELIQKITIGKSDDSEMEKISTLLRDVEKKLIEDYKVIYFNEKENKYVASDFGLVVYRTGFSPKTCLDLYNQLTKIAPEILSLKFNPKNLQFQKTSRDYFIVLVG